MASNLSNNDKATLRKLAKQIKEISIQPIMAERIRLWTKHNSLMGERPMILIFPEGAWQEILPSAKLKCENERARKIELMFRKQIYTFENFHSDNVVEGIFKVGKVIKDSGWGLEKRIHESSESRGSWGFEPIIKEPKDLELIKQPIITHYPDESKRDLEFWQDILGDILEIQQVGYSYFGLHLMKLYSGWRGLEEVMMDMYAEPNMLHDAMEILTQGSQNILDQLIQQNLLSLNNDNTYQNSGGNGYTTQLPKEGFDPDRVRPIDMWASAEAQEMAQVSPAMHEVFASQYERRILSQFGLNGYGCCEDLTNKLDNVFKIPNIRRISISPWADVDKCADKLGKNYIFSCKPNPSYLVGKFDTEFIREYISHTLKAAKNCNLEIILKDTHTCEHKPERFNQWSKIAQDLVNKNLQ